LLKKKKRLAGTQPLFFNIPIMKTAISNKHACTHKLTKKELLKKKNRLAKRDRIF